MKSMRSPVRRGLVLLLVSAATLPACATGDGGSTGGGDGRPPVTNDTLDGLYGGEKDQLVGRRAELLVVGGGVEGTDGLMIAYARPVGAKGLTEDNIRDFAADRLLLAAELPEGIDANPDDPLWASFRPTLPGSVMHVEGEFVGRATIKKGLAVIFDDIPDNSQGRDSVLVPQLLVDDVEFASPDDVLPDPIRSVGVSCEFTIGAASGELQQVTYSRHETRILLSVQGSAEMPEALLRQGVQFVRSRKDPTSNDVASVPIALPEVNYPLDDVGYLVFPPIDADRPATIRFADPDLSSSLEVTWVNDFGDSAKCDTQRIDVKPGQ